MSFELPPPPASALRRISSSRAIQDYLRDLIFSGRIRPGIFIRLEDVGALFGVSNTPVREAVAVLLDEKLIIVQTRRGITPTPLRARDVLDNFEVYAQVSSIMAYRHVKKMSDREIQDILAIAAKMETEPDPMQMEELNWAFHRMINGRGDARLATIARSLTRNIPRTFFSIVPNWSRTSMVDHRELCQAVQVRDAEAVAKLVVRHVVSGGRLLVDYLRAEGLLLSGDAPEDDLEVSAFPSLLRVDVALPGRTELGPSASWSSTTWPDTTWRPPS
jgi:DNA-binding GntR family transcriptional regulator